MSSLLFYLSLSAVLSTTSLMIVLYRVSPLLSPWPAIPAFFVTLFLTIGSVSTLLLYLLWTHIPHLGWDMGTLTRHSFRQGLLIACTSCLLLIFHLLGFINWIIVVLIILIVALVELAMH